MRFVIALCTTTLYLTLMMPTVAMTTASSEDKIEALHLDWIDPTGSPDQDFFAYANGTWQKQNPIPKAYSNWDVANVLQEKIRNIIHQMLIKAAQNPQQNPGSIEQKIGDFYFSGMNETTINNQGITPLNSEFARINAIKNLTDLQTELAHLQQINVNALFDFSSMQDYLNSQIVVGAAQQGGLGLPDRDYYLKKDKKFKAIQAAYVRHVTKMFELLGDDPALAATEASTIMNIETQLAQASMPLIEQRNPHATYHMMNLEQLQQKTPHFSWSHYFANRNHPEIQTINLAMPHFFQTMDSLLQTIPLKDWKTYLRWKLLNAYAPYLSQPFVEQNFQLTQLLTGAKTLLPRWKRVVNATNNALGFAIGKWYVEHYFSPDDKQQVTEIIHDIRNVLREDLQTLKWMTPETRKAALKKLDLMKDRVGYPSKWWDYSTLAVNRDSYVLNVMRANEFLRNRDLNKIGKPLDPSEWAMTPQTVNAYYDASMNNINLPAGILQTPFYDPRLPAVNYGGIGFVIGHEITHGFDDQGAQFDGYGNLKDWWTPLDLKKFQQATRCIAQQYSTYKATDDLFLQGQLVMGEATADLGGLLLAYRAFHHSKAYQEAKTINGFTPDQQFFLGLAHSWAGTTRPEQARNWALADPHPPLKYRVNGPLANIPAFAKAFNIPEKNNMMNQSSCVIW